MGNNVRNSLFPPMVFSFVLLSASFPSSFSETLWNKMKIFSKPPASRFCSAVFPLHGNVYPDGIYTVSLNIGQRPEPYVLDIDTGSDLTWLQCDAPCVSCTRARRFLYKPKSGPVKCNDPLCNAVNWPSDLPCKKPEEQCDYEVEYADRGSSLGVLVKDTFPVQFTNGTKFGIRLTFGCGYNQKFHGGFPLATDGVLGLGIGKSSIASQLHETGLIRNVFGHCLSRRGGFLFFGDDLVPSSRIAWVPMSCNIEKHYSLGPAEMLYGEEHTNARNLTLVFDSGSSYTYLGSQAYRALLFLVREDLKNTPLKDAAHDLSLPVCWKGNAPFKSVSDVKSYFKPLTLDFTRTKKVRLHLPPEGYLIVTKHGNVCMGILNGTEVGLEDLNIIGDISLQDKLVIYDNEKQRIGWIPANCDMLPDSVS